MEGNASSDDDVEIVADEGTFPCEWKMVDGDRNVGALEDGRNAVAPVRPCVEVSESSRRTGADLIVAKLVT